MSVCVASVVHVKSTECVDMGKEGDAGMFIFFNPVAFNVVVETYKGL